LLAGAVVTERIFAWPGMGRLFLDHLQRADGPVVMGIVIILAVFVVLSQILTDITYAALDPRIRYLKAPFLCLMINDFHSTARIEFGEISCQHLIDQSTEISDNGLEAPPLRLGQMAWRRFRRHKLAMTSLVMLVLINAVHLWRYAGISEADANFNDTTRRLQCRLQLNIPSEQTRLDGI
jgi:hypothetical protein